MRPGGGADAAPARASRRGRPRPTCGWWRSSANAISASDAVEEPALALLEAEDRLAVLHVDAGSRRRTGRRGRGPRRCCEIVRAAVPPPGSFQTATREREDDRDVAEVLAAVGPTDHNASARGRAPATRRGARSAVDGGLAARGVAAAAAARRRPARLDRLGREAVADPEVGVDVAPVRRGPLELLSAACARRRRPSGRRGPSRSPRRAGRSPRAAGPGPRPRRAAG